MHDERYLQAGQIQGSRGATPCITGWQLSMMHHFPAYCSAIEMFTVNRVPNCAAVIRNLTYRFMSRLSLSSNALVCSIIESDLKCVPRIRLHWMNILYVHFSGG